MVFRDRERDREFQLEMLRIQLKHEREVGFYSVAMTIGVSFLVLLVSFALAILLSGEEIPSLWRVMIALYAILSLVLITVSAKKFVTLKTAVEDDLETIRRKYSDW